MTLYYGQLNERDKKIYDALLPAIMNMEESCFIEDVAITEYEARLNVIWDIIQFIANDYPEIFWIPFPVSKNCTQNGKNGINITLKYPFGKEIKDEYEALINSYTDFLFSRFKSLSDYDYALAIFEWLTENVSYVNSSSHEAIDEFNSLYGVFCKYETRCLGYSSAFSIMMKKRNIRCSICSSTLVGVRHVWNIVELDGVWCHVDVCWADRNNSVSGESVNMSRYFYFGMTEREALVDCRMDFFNNLRESEISKIDQEYVPRFNKWPAADSDANSYYIKKGLYFTDESTEKICGVIKEKLLGSNNKSADRRISIRFSNKNYLKAFVEQISECVGKTVSELNKEHNLNYTFSSASFNPKFNICDMFFEA